jgi:peptidoglycan hydrolase-like protein with peptidoglycan-binding domain
MGASSVLNDDVGLNIPAEDVYVRRDVTRVEVDTPTLAIDLQRRLARRGYYHGPIDGIVGPGTRSAIAAYQADHGLEPNGRMTHETVRSLGL